jgi:hypothetical protein
LVKNVSSLRGTRKEGNGFIYKLGEVGETFQTCQWLYGEPKLRMFCDQPTKPDSSWCPEHHAKCFIRVDDTPNKAYAAKGKSHRTTLFAAE